MVDIRLWRATAGTAARCKVVVISSFPGLSKDRGRLQTVGDSDLAGIERQ